MCALTIPSEVRAGLKPAYMTLLAAAVPGETKSKTGTQKGLVRVYALAAARLPAAAWPVGGKVPVGCTPSFFTGLCRSGLFSVTSGLSFGTQKAPDPE